MLNLGYPEIKRINFPFFSDVFLTQLTALTTSRSVKTRRLAMAEENTELTRTAKLAQVFQHIYNTMATAKGRCEHGLKESCNGIF